MKELLIALAEIKMLTGKQKLKELKKPIPKCPNFDEVLHFVKQELSKKIV
jgi:hypothetical protein